MMKDFTSEYEGQEDFYKSYLQRVNNDLTMEDVLSDNNDGVLNGNLLEFKLMINDLSVVLFQTVKYLSVMRIKGKPIPENIILIALNEKKAYVYNSSCFLENIEKVYLGGASKNNKGFQSSPCTNILNYKNNVDSENLIKLLKSKNYTKINIDENCIVGWATKYYKENPNVSKSGFIGDTEGKVKITGEIRSPSVFKDFIFPYKHSTNIKFQYLMDKLNDDIQKKNLGAFYTPPQYANKSIELIRKAIQRVPYGNDYIILDRCAGTGNLELQLSHEELKHCVISTYEYYEYKVLVELLGDKVLHIIPPTENEDTFNNGTVRGADALSREYVEMDIIKQYLDNPKCTIILFENPPYAETTSIEHQKKGEGKASSIWKKSYVVTEMKKEVKGVVSNDLANAFIWSAFKYYLRQDTDSYIVFSPVKYWKAHHLMNKEFIDGFAFNRKHFHTNINACIMCALWGNQDKNLKSLSLKAFDIKDDKIIEENSTIKVKRVYTTYSKKYYEKRFFDDTIGLLAGGNGLEREHPSKKRVKPLFNDNILAYMVVDSSGFDNPDLHSSLLSLIRFNGSGFYLRADNYLEKLPMFVASRYVAYNRSWTQRAMVMKSGDGSKEFHIDVKNKKLEQFLLKCLLFTTLVNQNHMRTFIGSDDRFYRNEMCLDITNGDTLAVRDLKQLNKNETEERLVEQWSLVFNSAVQTKKYNNKLSYGTYQIFLELNTNYKNDDGNIIYDYPELNGHLNSLKSMLSDYYNNELVPTLFKYKFLV